MATREIAAIIGLSARSTRTRLARLIDRGLVREIGTSAKDPQRKYFLAKACACGALVLTALIRGTTLAVLLPINCSPTRMPLK